MEAQSDGEQQIKKDFSADAADELEKCRFQHLERKRSKLVDFWWEFPIRIWSASAPPKERAAALDEDPRQHPAQCLEPV